MYFLCTCWKPIFAIANLWKCTSTFFVIRSEWPCFFFLICKRCIVPDACALLRNMSRFFRHILHFFCSFFHYWWYFFSRIRRPTGSKQPSTAVSTECIWLLFPLKKRTISWRSTSETLVRLHNSNSIFTIQIYIRNKQIQLTGYGNEHFWTSGTDLAEEGNFFWMSSGRPITFTNWNAGEPNNFRYENGEEENCLELWNRDGKGLKWNDSPCSFETFFVCEVRNDWTVL